MDPLTWGAIGTAGAGILGSLFLSPDRGRPKKEPRAALVIVPTPTGLAVWISIDPKGIRL
jgi:hypothetical protein